MKKNIKKIGVLGGMGPAASARFYQMLIDKSQNDYNAVQDEDFPEIFLHSIALDEFGEKAEVLNESIKNQLLDGLLVLESTGVNFIVIPCNTVHFYYELLQKSVNVPMTSIIEATIAQVKSSGLNKIGLVCSEGTNKTGLYSKAFVAEGITCISPDEVQQKILNSIILNVMSGKQTAHDQEEIYSICDNYLKQGCQAIVIGCTELPLAIRDHKEGYKFFDTLEILANDALKNAYGFKNNFAK